MFVAIATSAVISQEIISSENSAVECEFMFHNNHYSCRLARATINNASIPLTFTGTHIPGMTNANVTRMFQLGLNRNVTIYTMHRDLVNNFPNLQVLQLSGVRMITIPINSFVPCRGLQSIELGSNWINSILPGLFWDCQNLRELGLANSDLRILPDETFFGLRNLEVLRMWGIRWINSRTFEHLENLRILQTGSVETIHPNALRHLRQLETLWMTSSNQSFTTVEDLIHGKENITILNFSGNRAGNINFRFFSQYSNLESLNLGENNLQEIPDYAFLNVNSMRNLRLAFNNISSLSNTTFAGLHNLETLDISHNIITEFPANVFNMLTNLRSLHISGNRRWNFVTEIHQNAFHSLTNLIDLQMSSMSLQSIHADQFSSLVNLENLELNNNQLTTLPQNIFTPLINIHRIYFVLNGIRRLNSNSFARHEHIEELWFQANEIDEIERTFFNNFPNLLLFGSSNTNPCINQTVRDINLINFTQPNVFDECFNNWDNPRTTTPATTTPGSGMSLKINVILMSMFLVIGTVIIM
jgi:Leucine-rich repeat (LRR) protein